MLVLRGHFRQRPTSAVYHISEQSNQLKEKNIYVNLLFTENAYGYFYLARMFKKVGKKTKQHLECRIWFRLLAFMLLIASKGPCNFHATDS